MKHNFSKLSKFFICLYCFNKTDFKCFLPDVPFPY